MCLKPRGVQKVLLGELHWRSNGPDTVKFEPVD